MEAILQEIEALGEEIPADILEELEKEIRRNEEANRMAKQMERTALAAKERALQSQMAMKEMVQKYEDIQAKVFDARSTLKETTEALERQTKLTRDVIDLRERTQRAALKHIQNEAKLEAAASTVAAAVIANETDSHILGRPVNSGGDSDGPSVSSSPKSSPHRPFSNPSSFSNSQHAQTVQRLQAKLAMKCIQQRPILEEKNEEEEEAEREETTSDGAQGGAVCDDNPYKEHKDSIEDAIARLEARSRSMAEAIERVNIYEESLQVRAHEALSDTKRGKVLIAEAEARKKEKEAEDMRKKVEEMQKMLSERKNRLRLTESAIEATDEKAKKFDKVHGLTERKMKYMEKKKMQMLMFDKK